MTYKMTVDLNVLDHLGINLYSNIAAVITEAVANAWDADATRVDINLPPDGKSIEIIDDGIGMSVADMNDKYLRVGYRRRIDDPTTGRVTARGRPVMGRKGLGKLSLFSIAREIEVHSAKNGTQHGLIMSEEGIKLSVENKEAHYSPASLDPATVSISKGTKIILRKIKRERLGRGIAALRKRLARRFSVIGPAHDFQVFIDNEPITPKDRGDLEVVQFLWELGPSSDTAQNCPKVLEADILEPALDGWEPNWKVSGWIGTAALPKQLDDKEAGNLNGIVVFARGRLFHENILDKLNDGRLYTKYVTGQIEADFLDDDELADIATSDRQRIQETDQRYVQLLAFLRARLSQLESTWTKWRQKHEVKKLQDANPSVRIWIDGLPPGMQDSAKKMLGNLGKLPVEQEDDRKTLIKHGILAFERLKLTGSAAELAEKVGDVDALLRLLADRAALEGVLYADIVRSRLEVIKAFSGLVNEDAKEKVLQKSLFDNLWLLDSTWEKADQSQIMESRLIDEKVITTDMSEKEKLGRVDIKYRNVTGKHLIVELKRAGRQMTLGELTDQGYLYVDKMKKILAQRNEPNPSIEVVFVIGKVVPEESSNPGRVKSAMDSIAPGSRIVHYDTLIHGAEQAYNDYLDHRKTVDNLATLLEQL